MEKKKARNENKREEYKRLKREIRKQVRNEKKRMAGKRMCKDHSRERTSQIQRNF